MKTILLILASALFFCTSLFSQTPASFKYQAVVRDEAGNILINSDIGLRICLLEGNKDGLARYIETHALKSNPYGLINMVIGRGRTEMGEFGDINWGEDQYYIKIEMDIEGGTDYKAAGVSQLFAVPYALYAEKAGEIANYGDDIKSPQAASRKSKRSGDPALAGLQAASSPNRGNSTTNSKLSADGDSWLNALSGNVGVGTTSPLQKVDVNGNISLAENGEYMINNITVMHNKGAGNVFVGDSAGAKNTTGVSNVAVGVNALYSNTERSENVAVGDSTLYNNGIGASLDSQSRKNTAIGSRALFSNTTGHSNTGIGYATLNSNTSGQYNTAVGSFAMSYNESGVFNTAIGGQSFLENVSGDENVAIGYTTARRNTSGSTNICIGNWANYYNQEGNHNVIIGIRAGKGTQPHSKSGNIFIGYRAGFYDTTDNKLYINNSDTIAPLLYGEFDNKLAAINGKLGVGTMEPSVRFHVDGGSDASLSGGGYILSGDMAADNIVIDNNEIMARNNGDINHLHLQRDGGNLYVHYGEDDITEFAVKTDGKTGIGSNSPEAKLHINTDAGEHGLRVQIEGTTKLKVASNGGIANWNAAAPTYAFQLQENSSNLLGKGRAYAWTTYSDGRVNSNQKEIQYGLKEVMQLQPKSYLYHSSERSEDGTYTMKGSKTSADLGFIAQEVQKIIPEAVSQPENELNELWSMDYNRLVPVLTRAIQEQQEQIDQLKEKIQELEGRLGE